MSLKKSVFFIFIAVFLQSIIFSVEKEKYMNNSYYKPLVEKDRNITVEFGQCK